MNFSDKLLITNPTSYHLGRGVAFAGITVILLGAITYFTGDILIPAMAWCALGMPTVAIGGIFWVCGLTKR